MLGRLRNETANVCINVTFGRFRVSITAVETQ